MLKAEGVCVAHQKANWAHLKRIIGGDALGRRCVDAIGDKRTNMYSPRLNGATNNSEIAREYRSSISLTIAIAPNTHDQRHLATYRRHSPEPQPPPAPYRALPTRRTITAHSPLRRFLLSIFSPTSLSLVDASWRAGSARPTLARHLPASYLKRALDAL